MTKREILLERLEETVFALMMDEVAKEEGRKALEENERLKADECFVVPETTYRKALATIRRHFSQQNRRAVMRTTSKAISRVAVIVLVMLLLFTTAFATIPEFRRETLNLIMEVFDDRTRIEFGESIPETHTGENESIVGWIPEGFELVESSETRYTKKEKYVNLDGSSIEAYICFSGRIAWEVDTENARAENVTINGRSAMMIFKGNDIQVVCPVMESECVYYVRGEELSEDIVMRVAESVDIQ